MKNQEEQAEGGEEEPAGVEKELAKGVAKMVVDDPTQEAPERVSGMDSFVGSKNSDPTAQEVAEASGVGGSGLSSRGTIRVRGARKQVQKC
jgi:hypothetical protein